MTGLGDATEPRGPAGSTRLMLVGCHDLLGALIRKALSSQPDLVVVADLSDEADPVAVARATQPDVIVWNTDHDGLPGSGPDLSACARTTKIIATHDHGRRASLWELRPTLRPVEELTPASLLNAIREVVGQ